jgi:4-amino-4-deoxy-L-arabinose transferase-like glycosyltransferase
MYMARRDQMMHYLKVACGLVCFLLLASSVWSMSHWNESRGVYDDICYLRQAHLFQRFGLSGLDTDIARDDDGYLASKLKEIGYDRWADPAAAPCHTLMPPSAKRVMQYPPGTGFLLALFPQGFQVIPLYVSATLIVFGLALLAIFLARGVSSIVVATAFGCLAVYLMINPTKASYSMAPTMAACALAGLLTGSFPAAKQPRHRLALAGLIGLIIGLGVNFRLPNLFLASGYLLFFGASFLISRKVSIAVQGALFALLFLLGMTPTLIANAVNAGNPFSTTYGGIDVAPPDLSFRIVSQYLADMQFVLILLAGASTGMLWRSNRAGGRQIAAITAGNLVVNLAFFVSHPIFTPYYTVPVAMLSLWSLLFASLIEPSEAVDGRLVGQAARA